MVQVITKAAMESMCRAAGMAPVSRTTIDGAEVFIADGFAAHPAITFQKFGIGPDDFPGGCYATLWMVSRGEDKLDIAQPMFFELLHDPHMSSAGKKYARINAAVNAAKEFLDRRKKVRH